MYSELTERTRRRRRWRIWSKPRCCVDEWHHLHHPSSAAAALGRSSWSAQWRCHAQHETVRSCSNARSPDERNSTQIAYKHTTQWVAHFFWRAAWACFAGGTAIHLHRICHHKKPDGNKVKYSKHRRLTTAKSRGEGDLKTSSDARIVARISESMKLLSWTVTAAVHANRSRTSSMIAT